MRGARARRCVIPDPPPTSLSVHRCVNRRLWLCFFSERARACVRARALTSARVHALGASLHILYVYVSVSVTHSDYRSVRVCVCVRASARVLTFAGVHVHGAAEHESSH